MPKKELITWKDFSKIDLRVGTVVAAFDFPEAHNPSYKLHLDFGPEIGVLKTAAQITIQYQKKTLIGKQLIAVVNFPKKQIANFMSECLVLGAVFNKEVTLLNPMSVVANGLKIS